MMRTRADLGAMIVIIVVLVAALPLLAYASPPDPTWTRGLYDDADFDDVVDFIASAAGMVEGVATPDLAPACVLCSPLPPPSGSVVDSDPPATRCPRAPPIS